MAEKKVDTYERETSDDGLPRKRTMADTLTVAFIGDALLLRRQFDNLKAKNKEHYANFFMEARPDVRIMSIGKANMMTSELAEIKFPVRVHGLIVALGAYELESKSSKGTKELAKNLMTDIWSLMIRHKIPHTVVCGVLPRWSSEGEELVNFNELVSQFNAHLKKCIGRSPNFRLMDFASVNDIKMSMAEDGKNLSVNGLQLFVFYLRQIVLEEQLPDIDKLRQASTRSVAWHSLY